MKIKWHGHACFEFSDNRSRVVIDPHDGESIGIKPPKATADVVLMSHDHYDHNASHVIGGNHVDYLAYNGRFVYNDVIFVGYRTYHDSVQGESRGLNTIYFFQMENMSFCHCGDVGDIPDEGVIEEIRKTDFLFIPVGGIYTMENWALKRFIEMVSPRVVVPMHYHTSGITIPIASIDQFLSIIPDIKVSQVGNSIEFSRGDLPKNSECWIFSV